jgi:hypothetical protein
MKEKGRKNVYHITDWGKMFKQRWKEKNTSMTLNQERDKYIPKQKTSNTVYHSKLQWIIIFLVMLLQYRQGTGEKLEKYKYYYFNFYLSWLWRGK